MKKSNNSSIVDTLILALMLALFMIGSHQIYVIAQSEGFRNGFFKSYYIFMFIVILMAVYQIRKNKRLKDQNNEAEGNHVEKKKVKSGKN